MKTAAAWVSVVLATSSLLLAACGGRSSSASGTTIPSASQIIDSGGHVWSVSAGAVYMNGAHAGSSANAALVLYYNGVIYVENNQGIWWSWNGTGFELASGDPRSNGTPRPEASSSASASGTTIPSSAQIVDRRGNVWTVSGGAIYINGGHAGSSANTALLLYYKDVIYTKNNQGIWWSWNNGTFTPVSGDPRSTANGRSPN